MAKVDIVLATYNGGPFLAEQLDSLLAQSLTDWHLIVRDDGSDDGSRTIIERYRRQIPEKMTVLDGGEGTLGHAQNFARTLATSDASYVAFCDQDDVWLPDKLQLGLDELQLLERHAGPETPALVFTDAAVVDAELTTLEDSFWASSGLHPEDARRLGRMLWANVVAGNTTMINAALRDAALPVPPGTLVIDWWVALLAAAIGTTTYLATPTLRYRRHTANAIGTRRFTTVASRGLHFVRDRAGRRAATAERYEQASALSARIAASAVAPAEAATLEAFLALPRLGIVERGRSARRHGLLPRGITASTVFVWSAPTWTSRR